MTADGRRQTADGQEGPSDAEERKQAQGGSEEPPTPDADTVTSAGDAAAAGDQVTDSQPGPGPGGGAAHPGVEETAAVQVPELHEVDVPDDLREEIERIIARYPQKRSAAIPTLFEIQRRHGWCTPEGIRQVAAVMGVTAAYLESVASFYDLLHLQPAGRHRVLVCTNISCWMRGADELLEAFCEAASVDPHLAGHGGAVSGDGEIFVSGFECLGACDLAPMASINERYYGPLELAEAARAVEALRGDGEVLPERAMALRPAAGGPEPESASRTGEAARESRASGSLTDGSRGSATGS